MVEAVSPPAGVVAMLFTDIEGSTELARKAGSGWTQVLSEHHELLRRAIRAEDGWIDATEGDAFFATFSDPAAASRAAVAALRALRSHRWPAAVGGVRVRMGIHVGYVERHEIGYVGLEVHRAARVADAAHGGQLLLSHPAYELVHQTLATESLGLHRLRDFPHPERLYCAVVDGIGAAAFPPPRTEMVRPTNLPAGAPALVGRGDDLARVMAVIEHDRERLVSLTGRGGAGKTTLALVVARNLLDSFPGGVWLASLAGVDTAEVVPTIAEAVGAVFDVDDAPFEAVVKRLRGRGRTLLVADNMEHVLGAAPELGHLLEALPDLYVLTTSQAPLRLAAELCLPLGALAPDAGLALMERVARRRDPGLVLGGEDRAHLREVVELLDGLPLALELAAARLALLSPGQLLEHLRQSPAMLSDDRSDRPERQRSLQKTVEWTLGMLDPQARLLFGRLGVFAGAAESEEIELVCAGDELDVLEALRQLLDVALVRRVEAGDGRIRFGLPQGLRQIAAAELDRDAHADRWRSAHARRQLEIVWPVRFLLTTRANVDAAVASTDERVQAIRWAETVGDLVTDPLIAAHGTLAADRGHLREAQARLAPLVARRPGDPEAQVPALIGLGWTCVPLGRLDEALHWLDQAVEIAGSAEAESYARVIRGLALGARGEHDAAVRDSERALELALEAGGPRVCGTLMLTAQACALAGDPERAVSLLDEAEEVGVPLDADFLWRKHTLRGDLEAVAGRPEKALLHYVVSLEEAERRAHEIQILFDLAGTALALASLGEDEAAVEVHGLSSALANEMGGPGTSALHLLSGELLAQARGRLDQAVVAEAEARGRRTSPATRVSRACALARSAAGVPAGAGLRR